MVYLLNYKIDIDYLIDGRYLSISFEILFMSTGVVDVDNRNESSDARRSGGFCICFFFYRFNLLKMVSHKHVDPKNDRTVLTFDKREGY